MRILFLLDTEEASAAEINAAALEAAWRGKHDVFWMADRLHLGQTFQAMSLTPFFPMGIIAALRIASFVKANRIQVIHSHSTAVRAAGGLAASLAGVPHVTTHHQAPSGGSAWGDRALAVDETVAEGLIKRMGSRERVRVVRNAIDLSQFLPSMKQPGSLRQIVILGRLAGARWTALQFLLDALRRGAKRLPPADYRIAGQVPVDRRSALDHQVILLNQAIAPAKVTIAGFMKNVISTIRDSDGIIAGGRSALEGLACGKPVLILGEAGVFGVANPQTWPDITRTNAGDHRATPRLDASALDAGLHELLTDAARQWSRWGREQIEKSFDSQKVASEVERVYAELQRR